MSAFTTALEAVTQAATALTAEYEALAPRVTELEAWAGLVTSPRVIRVERSADASTNVANLRAAIATLRGTTPNWAWGGRLLLEGGEWLINDTIVFQDFWGLQVIGDGRDVILRWRGAASGAAMLRFEHCRDCELAQVNIVYDAGFPGYAAIQTRRDNIVRPATGVRSVVPPRMLYLHDLRIECNNQADYGIVVGGVGAVDANNDFHHIERVHINAYKVAGIMTTGMQCYGLRADMCDLWAGATGQYGFLGTDPTTGSLHWSGGSMFGNKAADFRMGRTYQPMVIERVSTEGSARFMETTPNGGFRTVVMRACQWAANGAHADNRIMVLEDNIKLIMEGCLFGNGPASRPLTFDFGVGTNLYHHVSMTGCTVISTADSLWVRSAPNVLAGNTQVLSESTLEMRAIG